MPSVLENLKLDKIIRAAATVKTRSGLAALNLALVCVGFIFVLNTTDGILKWVLSILMFLCWQAFAVFAVFITKQDELQRQQEEKRARIRAK